MIKISLNYKKDSNLLAFYRRSRSKEGNFRVVHYYISPFNKNLINKNHQSLENLNKVKHLGMKEKSKKKLKKYRKCQVLRNRIQRSFKK
jgi:hypothetical protein